MYPHPEKEEWNDCPICDKPLERYYHTEHEHYIMCDDSCGYMIRLAKITCYTDGIVNSQWRIQSERKRIDTHTVIVRFNNYQYDSDWKLYHKGNPVITIPDRPIAKLTKHYIYKMLLLI